MVLWPTPVSETPVTSLVLQLRLGITSSSDGPDRSQLGRVERLWLVSQAVNFGTSSRLHHRATDWSALSSGSWELLPGQAE